jgi:hypothetical protein
MVRFSACCYYCIPVRQFKLMKRTGKFFCGLKKVQTFVSDIDLLFQLMYNFLLSIMSKNQVIQ